MKKNEDHFSISSVQNEVLDTNLTSHEDS